MLFFHALLMATIVWLLNSVCPMWLKWSTYLGAPLISGLINGIILGDVAYGLQFGATVMMAFLGIAVVGNAVPSDVCLAGYVGVTMSMLAGVDPAVGLTVSATLGALGTIATPAYMTINSFWVHRADKYAEEGNTKGIFYMNALAPLVFTFFLYFIPSFICIYFGSPLLDSLLSILPAWITAALSTVGHILPALGLAMLMQLLFKKSLIPFLILGFAIAGYLKLGIIPIAIIGTALALMHYMYTRKAEV